MFHVKLEVNALESTDANTAVTGTEVATVKTLPVKDVL